MSSEDALEFTGERFIPECVREIWYEHWHRYAFARRVATGKRVLDAACGEGYGSALLAGVAADVIGIDIDAESIAHARSRYASVVNTRFEQIDATQLDFPDRTFDLVVSFETLEHLDAQERLIAGFSRVLADDGLLLISSPDKHTYSELVGFRNEFHVKELYREELVDLLKSQFSHVRLYGQKLLFQSALWEIDEAATGTAEVATAGARGASIVDRLDYAPLYYIAVCSKHELSADLPALSFFGDREESVYAHYNHEIRKNMAAGKRIAELEADIARLSMSSPPSSAIEPVPHLNRRRWWHRYL